MTRAIVRLLPAETPLLILFELLISFLVVLGILSGEERHTLFKPVPNHLALSCTLAVVITAAGAAIGLYRAEIYTNRRRLLLGGVAAGVLVFPVLLLVGVQFYMRMNGETVLWMASLVAVWVAIVVVVRILLTSLSPTISVTRKVVIVGSGERADRLRRRLRDRHGFQLVGASADSPPAKRPWMIVLAGEAPGMPTGFHGTPVVSDFAFQEARLGLIELADEDAGWALSLDRRADRWLPSAMKRVFDVAISLGLLVATLPLLLLVAALIKLDSPGPAFYRQTRVGAHGRHFTLLKLRSMTEHAEAPGVARWAEKRDPRITRIGRFIRASRIDELPQILNVLHGEMSLVGPRPERPVFVEQLSRVIPGYSHRSLVKPGLTGWAQVNFPYGASVEDAREKLAYDLYYVKHRGIPLDLLILFSTVRVVLFSEGAR